MSNLIVHGGKPLRGRITPSANKNAVLPVLCATLLTSEPLRLHRVPDITDVRKILDIFRMLGSEVRMDHATDTLELHHRATRFDAATHRLPEEMRSSIMLGRRCWRVSAWRGWRTTSRAARWACARSTRTWTCSAVSAAR